MTAPTTARPVGYLRHTPVWLDVPDTCAPRWSLPLPKLRELAVLDGVPLVVESERILQVGAEAPAGAVPASWRQIAMPPGWAASALSGDPLWLAKDGRVLRWRLDGSTREVADSAEGAQGLDGDRIAITHKDLIGHSVRLLADGRKLWRVRGRLGGAYLDDQRLVVAGWTGLHTLEAYETSSGRSLWRVDLAAQGLSSIIGVVGGRLLVGCRDNALRTIDPETGATLHSLPIGSVPWATLDPAGRLHTCTATTWFTLKPGDPPVVERRVEGLGEFGGVVHRIWPAAGDRLLVATDGGTVALLGNGAPRIVWKGPHRRPGPGDTGGAIRTAWSSRERVLIVTGHEAPVLHCLGPG